MIKVVICDTDEDNGRNFKTFFKTNFPEFKVIKHITDVPSLLKIVGQMDCDLVVADIKFFGSGSYTYTKHLQEIYPEVMIILYGTFNESTYMEKAMENGVIAYMFKPVKPGDFGMCLEKAKERYEVVLKKKREREQLLNQHEKLLPVFMDRFLINLVHGHMQTNDEVYDTFQYFNLHLGKKSCVFVVQIDNYRQVMLALDSKDRLLLIQRVLQAVNKDLDSKKKSYVSFVHHFNSICVIINADDLGSPENIIKLCHHLKDETVKAINLGVTVGIGQICDDPLSIPMSYRQAKSALRYKHVMGENTVIPIQYVEPNNEITYSYPLKKEELLVYTTVVGDTNTSLNHLRSMYEALSIPQKLPPFLLSKIALDIVVSINRYASEQNVDFDEYFKKHVSMREINTIVTVEDWYNYMKKVTVTLCDEFNSLRQIKLNSLYDDIVKYIETNYFENISLSKVAMKLNCTPEFVNKILDEKEGTTYYDKVIDTRLETAKNLMENQSLTDENIASLVGYDDAKYFKSVFFHKTGYQTHEFREIMGQ